MSGNSQSVFGSGNEPYIVAEVGGNHGGELSVAKEYITEAAETGVDAVKFQLYQGERLITADVPPYSQVGGEYESQKERFQSLELTRDEWEECLSLANELGIDFVASVFDPEMVDFISDETPFLKIASGDLTHTPLLRHAANAGRPIVLSTGCATMDEIRTAVAELPTDRLTLLHCVSSYPTAQSDANLNMIDQLREEFELPVGYSDHTVGTRAATVAVCKGAPLIEKHFTLDDAQEVGDHSLSATPAEMTELVEESQRIADTLGDQSRGADSRLEATSDCGQMRRSLATASSIAEGETITESHLTALRPETGVSPVEIDTVVGTSATRDLPKLTILTDDDYQ